MHSVFFFEFVYKIWEMFKWIYSLLYDISQDYRSVPWTLYSRQLGYVEEQQLPMLQVYCHVWRRWLLCRWGLILWWGVKTLILRCLILWGQSLKLWKQEISGQRTPCDNFLGYSRNGTLLVTLFLVLHWQQTFVSSHPYHQKRKGDRIPNFVIYIYIYMS